jgi:hypothetical protein
MTDGRDGDGSTRLPGASLTRRTVLKTAGLLSLLADSAAAEPPTADDGAPAPGEDGTDERAAVVGGTVGRCAEAVDVAGATAVVGVPPPAETDEPATGRAVVLDRSDGTWTRQATLSPDGDGGQFGRAVAVDGDVVVVGGELGPDTTRDHAGSAAVFVRDGTDWTRRATLRAPDTTGVDLFGTAVDVDSDTVLVGASGATGGDGASGAAFVFTRSGGRWTRQARLTPPAGVEEFGRASAVDGETAVVGARRTEGAAPVDSGTATVYRRTGKTWRQRTELTPPGDARDDEFGTALAVDGRTVLVGAPAATTERGINAGVAHVFARRNGAWRRQATLRDEDGGATSRFGTAVALDGNLALVGTASRGGPLVFGRSAGTWTHADTLRTSAESAAAPAVAVDGTRVFVGTDASRAYPSGSVEVFEP